MTKYQNHAAKVLHSRWEPDDEVGEKDELGWAGRYDADGQSGGIILEENSIGFVTFDHYAEDHELRMAWEDRVSRLSNDGPEPEEEDYVIQNVRGGYAVTPLGTICESLDDAYMEIHAEMHAHNFFPNVWLVSDHGNFLQIEDLDDEVSRILNEEDDPPGE